MLKCYPFPAKENWTDLLKRPAIDPTELNERVQYILADVKAGGDKALKEFNLRFDGVSVKNLMVSKTEINEACDSLDLSLKTAIEQAAANIKSFHNSQKEETQLIETMPGVKCWRKPIGIERVGLYIPGGSAPLFSTVLMLGIPAQLAGCREIVLCTPPNKQGLINPAILFAANLCGIKKIIKVGGAQAIGAMAYGTESVPKCYKIFGPGNQYVTCAKQLVSLEGVAIDMPAGPSELAIVADDSAVPAFIAADLLSQAEHGPDSQVIFFTTVQKLVEEVNTELRVQLKKLPREKTAVKALENSKAFILKDEDQLMTMVNDYAPEHLILATSAPEVLADKVINAGSVFLGNYTPESAGDYASGTNHTLPTNGFAKAYSGVSLDSFVKKITFQQISKEGLQNLGPTITAMAEAEQLQAHANAVTVRLAD